MYAFWLNSKHDLNIMLHMREHSAKSDASAQ